jgi:ABC-type polar amino acid transport system ATPase subunit
MTENGSVLGVRGVRLNRGDKVILADISFDVARGELVALMGPSGCGKTTLLRTIAGLERFQAGTIEVDGVRLDAGPTIAPDRLRALRRKVGMVFQAHNLFEHLSVMGNVCLAPVHAYGVAPRDAERRAHALLTAFGVDHRAEALPRHLSGGEMQRVAIARSLAVDPPLLLMDEPTASLDPVRRAELGELMHGLLADRRSLVMTTHDEEYARRWATRVLRLSGGLLEGEGPPR